jgi:hypothetical protein
VERSLAVHRRVAERAAQLDETISERHARLGGLEPETATTPLTFVKLGPLLDRLPVLTERTADAPKTELRAT